MASSRPPWGWECEDHVLRNRSGKCGYGCTLSPMAGRPPKPIAADAPPQAARIGAEVRRRRLAQGLTLAELGLRPGYSPQYLSSLELASGTVTRQCLAAID